MASSELDDIIKDKTLLLQWFVKSKVSNRDDADDIVQDTLYQFLRTISIMENPIAHVTSWLYTVAHNLIVNHGKKHREVAELSEIMIASDNDNPEMLMLRNMVWEELEKAMADLPKEQREAIEMTEVEGLSTKDAAQKMGVSVNTFLSRKHYGMMSIRKRLNFLYEELVHNS